MDARHVIERLLDYVRQSAEDMHRIGDVDEIVKIDTAIILAERYLADTMPVTPVAPATPVTPAAPYLTDQELNTVLACMRYCQYGRVDLSGMDHFEDESYGPLSWDAVDRLIENKLYELAE